MAVYTRIYESDLSLIEKNFQIGKILSFSGIKKGIENTNYLIRTNNKKIILTIFEKRVLKKDLPFFMDLMFGLSKQKIKCPEPLKNRKGKYLFKIKKKTACLVSFLEGNDKVKLTNKDCYTVGKNVALLHLAAKKLKLYRKNSLSVNSWGALLNRIDKRINRLSSNLINIMKNDLFDIRAKWPKDMPNGIIHSDLFIDNIFFYKNRYYGFIDFYFSANDFLAYELATCVNALCFKKGIKFLC